MSWDGKQGCSFWLTDQVNPFKVWVLGVERTDYLKISKGTGERGIFFTSLTYAEACDVQVEYEVELRFTDEQ